MTVATTEELDLAEVLAHRHDPDTPLWNELLAEYDADTLADLGRGWPDLTTVEQPPTPDEQPAEGEPVDEPDAQPSGEPSPEPVNPEPNATHTEPEPQTGSGDEPADEPSPAEPTSEPALDPSGEPSPPQVDPATADE